MGESLGRQAPLIVFTSLVITSVGLLVGATVAWLRVGAGPDAGFPTLLAAATATAVFGLGAAFLHLGHPLRAWRVPAGAKRSWLSRESLLAVMYVICLAGVLWTRYTASRTVASSAALFAAIGIGLLLLGSVVRLYRLPSQRLWNHPASRIAPFTGAALVGTVAAFFGAPPTNAGFPVLALAALPADTIVSVWRWRSSARHVGPRFFRRILFLRAFFPAAVLLMIVGRQLIVGVLCATAAVVLDRVLFYAVPGSSTPASEIARIRRARMAAAGGAPAERSERKKNPAVGSCDSM